MSRYAEVLNGVEINSSFYNDHMKKTYEKWAAMTPPEFQFSVKLHQLFTHHSDLKIKKGELKAFLKNVHGLKDKWEVMLLQFPPKLEFDEKKLNVFYKTLRENFDRSIVIEPRNATWAKKASVELMKYYQISKVIADPERCSDKKMDFGKIRYYRLHGTPEIYKSSYSKKFLNTIREEIKKSKKACWCMFDNTARGEATGNALYLLKSL